MVECCLRNKLGIAFCVFVCAIITINTMVYYTLWYRILRHSSYKELPRMTVIHEHGQLVSRTMVKGQRKLPPKTIDHKYIRAINSEGMQRPQNITGNEHKQFTANTIDEERRQLPNYTINNEQKNMPPKTLRNEHTQLPPTKMAYERHIPTCPQYAPNLSK